MNSFALKRSVWLQKTLSSCFSIRSRPVPTVVMLWACYVSTLMLYKRRKPQSRLCIPTMHLDLFAFFPPFSPHIWGSQSWCTGCWEGMQGEGNTASSGCTPQTESRDGPLQVISGGQNPRKTASPPQWKPADGFWVWGCSSTSPLASSWVADSGSGDQKQFPNTLN